MLISADDWLGRHCCRSIGRHGIEQLSTSRAVRSELENSCSCVAERALDRDNFMDPEEAKQFGLIDHIATHSPDADK